MYKFAILLTAVRVIIAVDPFGSFCFEGDCSCKPQHTIELENGVCLEPVPELGGACWITTQCKKQNSICMRPKGRELDTIYEQFWDLFIESNGSARYIPGRCHCAHDHLEVMTDGPEPLKCVKRGVGSSCKTSYECASKTSYSLCKAKKCVCFDGFVYQASHDKCVREEEGVYSYCHESDKFCPAKEAIASVIGNTMTNLMGLLLSFVLIVAVWYVCWWCNKEDPDEMAYERRFDSRLMRNDNDFNENSDHEEALEDEAEVIRQYEDGQLPSYDEATQRIGVGISRKSRDRDQVIDAC